MDEMQRDFYTKTEVDGKFGGMVIEKISKADFDALTEKDPNKIYYVYDDQGNITQYIGEAELSSGGVPPPFYSVIMSSVLPYPTPVIVAMERLDDSYITE